MKKIAILGLHNDRNMGDPLICQTVMKLYESCVEEVVLWKKVDLRFYHSHFLDLYKDSFMKYLIIATNKFFSWFARWDIAFVHNLRIIYLSYEMDKLVKGSDKAIIAGGGIVHYIFHDYYAGICSFILACQRNNIPVIINAVGIEGFDNNSSKCKMFSKYLRNPIVKFVSTRDNINILKNYYLKKYNTIPVIKVPDPVLLCSKVFPINIASSNTIGIGIIRENVFDDYKVDAKPDLLCNYYCGLAYELEKRGLEYEFFINGLKKDLSLLRSIEKKLNRKIKVRIPNNVHDFLSIITSYRGIITARMHSCIVAYSYNLPAIAFNWNDKLPMWFMNINRPDCCFELSELDPSMVIDKFLELESNGYDIGLRTYLENAYLDSLKTAIRLTG